MKWKTSRYLYLSLLVALGFLYSCEKATLQPVQISTVSFSKDIQPIFTSNCIVCHNGSIQNPNLQSGAAYNSLINGGFVNTSSPADSKIYTQINATDHKSRTTDVQKQQILVWIKDGAKND